MQAFSRLETPAYVLLRFFAGSMFLVHGLGKVFGILGKTQPMFSQLWFGGVIELVCGALIAVGLITRWAAFLASGTMAVAYFQFHFKGEVAAWHWLPSVNKGEMSVLYCFIFLLICARGAGAASIDRALGRDR